MAGLHKHHDHSVDVLAGENPRFAQTIICDQCNAADGAAKRKLALPKRFSFSPQEIAWFVVPSPHGRHKIVYEAAQVVYDAARQNYPQFVSRW